MTEPAPNPHRQQQLYWAQMFELKVASVYMRRYRDHLGKWVTGIGTVRAVASSGSIAAWALWREFAFLWAVIIAVSRVLDALKDVFPVTKRHKAASEHANTLGSMFIDAQLEWENIFAGRYTDEEIMNRRHQLMKLQHEAERTNFPEGLAATGRRFQARARRSRELFQNHVWPECAKIGVNTRSDGMPRGVLVPDEIKSLIMPAVTVTIEMPQGAAVPPPSSSQQPASADEQQRSSSQSQTPNSTSSR